MADTLVAMARVFALLSLLSFGGGNGITAEIQRQAIAHGWVTPREFLDLFALARAAPGPGMQLVTLIGLRAAGWQGAVVVSVAMALPCGLLLYFAATAWKRIAEAPWKRAVEAGLAPIAVGLTFAGVATLLQAADQPASAAATAIVCALILTWTRVHPLLPLAAAGAVYMVAG